MNAKSQGNLIKFFFPSIHNKRNILSNFLINQKGVNLITYIIKSCTINERSMNISTDYLYIFSNLEHERNICKLSIIFCLSTFYSIDYILLIKMIAWIDSIGNTC